MGTLASGSIDLKSLKVAGDGANSYITVVDNTGIMVHPNGDDTTGWKISSALELKKSDITYIKASLENSNVPTVQVGTNGAGHSIIDSNGMRIYGGDGTKLIANLGYGEGKGLDGTYRAPYYTFGNRDGNIGNYSVVEGKGRTMDNVLHPQVASGYCSHAEGSGNTASGDTSHAEGSGNTASGDHSHAEGWSVQATNFASHAEGNGTVASGISSHAEGDDTTASGQGSHASGYLTTAKGDYQTVIGKYNKIDNNNEYAFIIGNGVNSRSNAFTIDWNGVIDLPANGGYQINGHNLTFDDLYLIPSTVTTNASTSTGTYVSSSCRRYGQIVQLTVGFRNVNSVASNGVIYNGTITNLPLPILYTTSCSNFNSAPLIGSLNSSGTLVIRNCSPNAITIGSSNTCYISFTYIANDF